MNNTVHRSMSGEAETRGEGTRRVLKRAACGAVAGLVAVVPMTVVMLFLQRLLPRREQEHLEPRQITDVVLDEIGADQAGDEERRAAAVAAHFSYGAAMGATYPAVQQFAGRGLGRGTMYGLALYTASYAGWLPALGILPPPQQRPWRRNALLIASHVVWGLALDYSTRRLTQLFPDAGNSVSPGLSSLPMAGR